MDFILKDYQQRCVDAISAFLIRASDVGAKKAFLDVTERPYRTVGLPESLKDLPYVCVRVPTGGGKTLLAAHSVAIGARSFLATDHPLVLWLAPTTTIVDQTLAALRDRTHPYRKALDVAAGGQVTVYSLNDALHLSVGDLQGSTCIVVCTMAALRVEDTEGRRVYDSNGSLQAHFSGLGQKELAWLETGPAGTVPYSLANVFRLHRPFVIMDEAHSARTPLSFESLQRFRPSVVLEFTATPDEERNPSNVLYSVSAAELKAEQMIKLPIQMLTRPQWKEAVGSAIQKQKHLERLAQEDETLSGEYIRPIVLFQAQNQSTNHPENVTVSKLKQCLLEDFQIPAGEVAEGTGTRWELPDELLTKKSGVRFVITVQALREGWDCPFAYILCSVANLTSQTAIEQILGRILRMPYAHKKKNSELNLAYAFATSPNFAETAGRLRDAMVQNGFQKYEADLYIQREGQTPSLFDGEAPFGLTANELVSKPPKMENLPASLKEKIQLQTLSADSVKLTYAGPPLTGNEVRALQSAFDADEDKRVIERLARKLIGQPTSPAALGDKLTVPYLALRSGGQLEIFEDQFREEPWELTRCDPRLSETEFPTNVSHSQLTQLDVDREGIVKIEFLEQLHEQLSFLEMRGPKTAAELAAWLDRSIEHRDISQTQASLFLLHMVTSLIERGMKLEEIVESRFRLRDAASRKIAFYRESALRQSFQRLLYATGDSAPETLPNFCFEFPPDEYPASSAYLGALSFKRHYYDIIGDLNSEEAPCAFTIDSSPQVKYWVRNLERRSTSFWLQTSTDKFYPDFVVLLTDGRRLVVEYKGAPLLGSDDTKEKKEVGELWEARSKGTCLFRLVGQKDFQTVLGQVLTNS
jgi:type III restriction enzyme